MKKNNMPKCVNPNDKAIDILKGVFQSNKKLSTEPRKKDFLKIKRIITHLP